MAELNVRAFLCGFNHIGFMTEAVCKNDVTAVIGKVESCFLAFCAFGNVDFGNIFNVKCFTSRFSSLNEVVVLS